MYKFPLKGFKQSDTPTFTLPRWVIPVGIGIFCLGVYVLIRYYRNKKAQQQTAAVYQETLTQKEAVLTAQQQKLNKYGLDRIQSNPLDNPA